MKAETFTKETIRELGVRPLDFPDFQIGDRIAVSQRIMEGDKERIQIFEGDVIAMHNNGISSTFTVRKIGANNVPVELILPLYSPRIASIRYIRSGKVRRAKLYYLRNRIGKAAQVAELVLTKEAKRQKIAANEKRAFEAKQI